MIYPILNITPNSNPLETLNFYLGYQPKMIQLRAKNTKIEEFVHIARSAKEIRDKLSPKTKIIINDKIEVYEESGADGLHIGQKDTLVVEAKNNLKPNGILGLSTNNIRQIKSAPLEILNYVAIGPIFVSNTKFGHAEAVGLQNLFQIKSYLLNSNIQIPLVAIGGIGPSNYLDVLKTGADIIATIEYANLLLEITSKETTK